MIGCRSRRQVLGLSFAVAFAAGWVDAQPPTPPDSARLREWFQSVDHNGNGRINREEYHRWATERFFFLDRNRQGFVTVDEVRDVVGPEAFKTANRQSDGRLTLREFVNAVFQDFDAADVDQDGTLTLEEVEAYLQRTQR